ncbi:MAG: hypothetical protein HYV28_00970, partial [Ignavibacteriales bacterium]|nr:hypothetical protein [Ignavibacteriales bacterium]
MTKFKSILFLSLMALMTQRYLVYGKISDDPKNNVQKILTNDKEDNIAINRIKMIFYNNGIGSYNRVGGSSGLYWDEDMKHVKTAIFQDGVLLGFKVMDSVFVEGSAYRTGLQAGKILPDRKADDPKKPEYKIWKIRKGWENLPAGSERDRLEYDYNNWPVADGAPWEDIDGDGIFNRQIDRPKFLGDEVNWYVVNDLDSSRTLYLYGSNPIGLEIQTSIFAFTKPRIFGDVVFKKYIIINKGSKNLKDGYFSIWSDPDLGDAGDDFIGSDTLVNMAYCYNGDNFDAGANGYDEKPPAVGYILLQGPVVDYDKTKYHMITRRNLPDSAIVNGHWIKSKTNLPMTSIGFIIGGSAYYSDPVQGDYIGAKQVYNMMSGKIWNGRDTANPIYNQAGTCVLTGDPETRTGEWEGSTGLAAGDRRVMLNTGKFDLASGDSLEVIYAIALARGTSNYNSVTELKKYAQRLHGVFKRNFANAPLVPTPSVTAVSGDNKAVLYWADNAESYTFIDESVLPGENKLYDFEGYQVFQYSDSKGNSPHLVATFDRVNADSIFTEQTLVYGVNVDVPQITGTNKGIQRVLHINSDYISKGRLYNSKEYYFGVVAFAYNPDGEQRIVRSIPSIVKVVPQPDAIGDAYPKRFSQSFSVTKAGRVHDGLVSNYIVDEKKLTGHIYEVGITKSTDTTQLLWSLKDLNTGVVLLKDRPMEGVPTSQEDILINADIVDGFAIKVSDPGNSSRRVKEVIMVQEAGKPVNAVGEVSFGIPREGINVLGVTSTVTGRTWWLDGLDSIYIVAEKRYLYISKGAEGFNHKGYIGNSDIEIRFEKNPSLYSEYYPFLKAGGLGVNITSSAKILGKDKLPFSVWQINNPKISEDDKRMYLKVYDGGLISAKYADSSWSHAYIDSAVGEKDSVVWEKVISFPPFGSDTNYVSSPHIPLPLPVTTDKNYRMSFWLLSDNPENKPQPGTVIKVNLWKPLTAGDKMTFVAVKPLINNKDIATANLGNISVYPNPYYGIHKLENGLNDQWVQFTNLPPTCTIRIYALSGEPVRKIDRTDASSTFQNWDL